MFTAFRKGRWATCSPWPWAWAIALALSLTSAVAVAHSVGISRGDYVVRGATVAVTLAFARSELALAIPALERDDGPAAEELGVTSQATSALALWTRDHLRLWAEGQPCVAGEIAILGSEQDGVLIATTFTCTRAVARVRVQAPFVSALRSGHRHLAHIVWDGGARDIVVVKGEPAFELALRGATPASGSDAPAANGVGLRMRAFVWMGIEHILTGYDHLLFVLGLLLVLGPLRSLIAAITAFTVAHSLTLTLATLGTVAPSPRIIEPLIALSIVYVGVENWFVTHAVGRWRLTLFFGLIHGFGFAGALREIAIPHSELPLALGAFNAGVEVGQLTVVAVAVPALLFARSRGILTPERSRLLSVLIALAGAAWFVARVTSG